MMTLQRLAMQLASCCEQADLIRLRGMTQAEFSILLALVAAEEFSIEAVIREVREGGAA